MEQWEPDPAMCFFLKCSDNMGTQMPRAISALFWKFASYSRCTSSKVYSTHLERIPTGLGQQLRGTVLACILRTWVWHCFTSKYRDWDTDDLCTVLTITNLSLHTVHDVKRVNYWDYSVQHLMTDCMSSHRIFFKI